MRSVAVEELDVARFGAVGQEGGVQGGAFCEGEKPDEEDGEGG